MPASEPSGCLFAIFRLFRIRSEPNRVGEAALPYRRKDYLLSRAEASFFGVLNNVIVGQYLVFAKVRLADLLYIPKGTQGRQAAFNRIQSKHVDFLLCDKDAVRPLLAIELNDCSHAAPSRIIRDAFVVKALMDAGLPLIQFPARASYNTAEVADRIRAAIRPAG